MTATLPESQRLGLTAVVSPTQVAGSVAPFHVTGQTNARTRLQTPTGAQRILIVNDCDSYLRVVFNIDGTTEASNALAESPATAGGEVGGVSYIRIPPGKYIERGFPDPLDRLLVTDWITESAQSPGGGVWGEVTI